MSAVLVGEGSGFKLEISGDESLDLTGIHFGDGGLEELAGRSLDCSRVSGTTGQPPQEVEVREITCGNWSPDGRLGLTLKFKALAREVTLNIAATFEYTIDLIPANNFGDFVEAFNTGFCHHFGGHWSGRYEAFNDYLNWAPQPYQLTFLGWHECAFLANDKPELLQIFEDNSSRARVVFI